MADFYDISKWSEKPWYQTGGTRNKMVVENPNDHNEYYFKTSLKRENKDYKYEYWSEIIASEVGIILGFDMLRYDVACNHGVMGCISKSMVTEGKNKLTEGISYLTGYDITYNPKDKNSKKEYTFQLIFKTLKSFKLERFIEDIIEIIVIDSIIGNGDRHQENWGIITDYNEVIKIFDDGLLSKVFYSIISVGRKVKHTTSRRTTKMINMFLFSKFSQIYDSGSCLGREHDDEKVKQMLMDKSMMDAYVRRGVSEIHWEGEKLNHFDLIQKVNKMYPDVVNRIVTRVESKYNELEIQNCIENIDLKLPKELEENKLPLQRKEFVIKLIALRVQTLLKSVR